MDWAQDEVEAAQKRHGETGHGPIWKRGFLAVNQPDLIWSEMLFRAHCREILDRIAAGTDLRPGTNAELISTLHSASLGTPLTAGVDTLYFRIFARTFPGTDVLSPAIDLAAYERVHGSAADDHEARLRAKLARDRT
jgi:hypothetical protein